MHNQESAFCQKWINKYASREIFETVVRDTGKFFFL